MTAINLTPAEQREHVAHEIWSHTADEDGCPNCRAYEPCDLCMQVTYGPAADAVLAMIASWSNGSGQECEGCFGSGSKANVPVHVECPDCGGTGVKNGHAHGKLKHAHAHADEPHAHLLRAICQRPECEPYPTHDIHRGPGYGCDRFGEHP